ncbi:MAG: cysteine--tRNA ligase [Parcubacteria group bacterium]
MLKFHNTLTGDLEEFKPLKSGQVSMYHCGPTVYDHVHIGNLRSYVFADILRRTFEYLGHKVKQVVNITDIGHLSSDSDTGDDKMMKGLKREGLPLSIAGLEALADKYETAFKKDLGVLNIKTPQDFPRATRYLEDEIALVQKLEDDGYAYRLDDGVYFDTTKLSDYGRLGGLTPLGESETRVETASKKSPRDFVLWKISKDDHMGFPSPWGLGFPGWHIECSAMSRALLGQPFDIHTGGIDHIPVHHNNEIAQSEAAYGLPLANYWLHNEFLNLSGVKMAKSEGNFLTLKALEEKGFSPLAYRYFLLMAHYRTPVNFTWEALEAAENAFNRLKRLIDTLPDGGQVDQGYKMKFIEKIENDLNTPQALALLWTLLKDKEIKPEDKKATAQDFCKVYGLGL